jgi:hypothetical protein
MRGITVASLCAALALLNLAEPVRSASFWPESGRPVARTAIKRFSVVRLAGFRGRYIQIDDQLFPEQATLLSGFSGAKWPGGKLIYQFDSSVDTAKQLVFITSCNLWKAVAHVECVARTTETSYVQVMTSNENSSTIGKQPGVGTIKIMNWDSPLTVAHEIGHSFGLAHEQCRSDRDTYVQILTANIVAGKSSNFDIANTDDEGTSYDFDSVMHYWGTAFGRKDPMTAATMTTILVKPPNQAKQSTIGRWTRLSAGDAAGMAARYGAP